MVGVDAMWGTGGMGATWLTGGVKWGSDKWGGGGSLRGNGGHPWGPRSP